MTVLATLMWRHRCVQQKHGSGEEGTCLCCLSDINIFVVDELRIFRNLVNEEL